MKEPDKVDQLFAILVIAVVASGIIMITSMEHKR